MDRIRFFMIMKNISAILLLILLLFPGNARSNSGKTHILYHYPKSEIKISSALKTKAINVPIYKIGVGKEGKIKIALVQIGISKNLTKSELARNVLEIIVRAFKAESTLHRIDIYGSDRQDTKRSKGEVLFSISALHRDIHRINPCKSSLSNLNIFGLFYISGEIKDPLISWRRIAMKQIHHIFLMKEKTKKDKKKSKSDKSNELRIF